MCIRDSTGAGNFDADSLKEAVRFCHARGVAVHVALNTTVYLSLIHI